MSADFGSFRPGSLAGLRKLTREREPEEACELCGNPVNPDHRHLVDPTRRQLLCSCDGCALLFSSGTTNRYRLIPRQTSRLTSFQMTDEQWDELLIPVNMAFFHRSSGLGKVVAYYPSPAGATESTLPLETWSALETQNPVLTGMQPDVQALLVNRTGETPRYFLAPIDECYKLVGLIRAGWRGLTGGTEVWKSITAFFADLERKGMPDA